MPVTITATPKIGGTLLTYSFSVNRWFDFDTTERITLDTQRLCTSKGMMVPEQRSSLSLGAGLRGMNSLWSEWGNLSFYIPMSGYVWTTEIVSFSVGSPAYMSFGVVALTSGQLGSSSNVLAEINPPQYAAVCMQDL